MQSLFEIQKTFQRAIRGEEAGDLSFISSSDPKERFEIYRLTLRENMKHALALTFPGVRRLLGEECADTVAYSFLKDVSFWPETGCFDDWGEAFPSYLRSLEGLESLPYLGDYAYYEWLRHLSYGAPSEKPLAQDVIQTIPEDRVPGIRFSFAPSVCFYQSAYPISEICDVVEGRQKRLTLKNRGKTFGIISRELTYWIAADQGLFLKDLCEGKTLGEAHDLARVRTSDFDLIETLHFMLSNQLVFNIDY